MPIQPPSTEELARLRSFYEFFMPLPDAMWERMAEVQTAREYKKGEMFVEAGAVCQYVGFVTSGMMKSVYLQDDVEVVAGFFYDPGFVTEYSSFLRRSPATRTITALEPTRVLCMNYPDLQKLYSDFGADGERLGRLIAEGLFHAFNDRMAFLLEAPDERYRQFVQRSSHLLQRVPLYLIASYLQMTPETLSRVRRRIMNDERPAS